MYRPYALVLLYIVWKKKKWEKQKKIYEKYRKKWKKKENEKERNKKGDKMPQGEAQ